MNNEILCSFKVLDINPKLFKCEYCGIIVQSKDLKRKYLCGVRIHNLSKNPDNKLNIKLTNKETTPAPRQTIQSKNQCSQDNIDKRLSVCKTCEFYQNNTCMQCGCALSRDRVYMNKLYWPDQSCPIGKWGPVPPEES
jgi:hypothetical protein